MLLRDDAGTVFPCFEGTPRIVSLVPSLTELLCDLGLDTFLVGRTGFCVHPRDIVRRIPKVGGTKDVRIDAVRALEPTHLVVNIDENRKQDVEAMARFVPNVIVTHPLCPRDNAALFALFGGIFGREAAAARLAVAFGQAAEELERVRQELPREKVLYLIWREPWMTISRATYIAATLAAAGWDALPEHAEVRYPEVRLDEAWIAGIDRVLLPSEPYVFRARHVAELRNRPGFERVPIQLVDGEYVSWYGSRAIAGMRYLADLRTRLHRGVASPRAVDNPEHQQRFRQRERGDP